MISNSKPNIILEAGAVHDADNLSGHSPIFVEVDLAKANNSKEEIKRNPRLNWVGSSSDQKEEYVQHLENLLQDLSETPEALLCENVLYDHPVHVSDIDQATKSC